MITIVTTHGAFALAAAAALLPAAHAQRPDFAPPIPRATLRALDAHPGAADANSGALAVSADGSHVLGWANSPLSRAAREATYWGASTHPTGVGTLPTLNVWGSLRAISRDGLFLVGDTNAGEAMSAVIWSDSLGLSALPALPGSVGSTAAGVASGGGTVVGTSDFRDEVTASHPVLSREATRWENGVATGLGFLPGGASSEATDVSPDGRFVVGRSDVPMGFQSHEAFLWSATGGMQSLGDLPGGYRRSLAVAVSDDGSVVAGWGMATSHPFRTRVWRWTNQTGLVLIDLLTGDFGAEPTDMSGDGNVIVGWSTTPGGAERRPFIWDPVHGTRDLMAVLESQGADISPWRDSSGRVFMEAQGVSADGKTVVGTGRRQNEFHGWVATIL
ncbi:MAG: putative membrane protein [Planctomycetota bacterium]|jgi:uncharacterized membrane protein